MIEARVECYRTRVDAYVPVDAEGFQYLFDVARGNLRTALRYSDEFSTWAFHEDVLPADAAERQRELANWLERCAQETLAGLPPVGVPAWQAFDALVDAGGALPEHLALASGATEACRELEQRGLVERVKDPVSPPMIALTRTAWLVQVIPLDRRNSDAGA